MFDSNDVMYHLSHVHLGLAKVTYVARVRVRIVHLILRHIIQPCVSQHCAQRSPDSGIVEKRTKTKPHFNPDKSHKNDSEVTSFN